MDTVRLVASAQELNRVAAPNYALPFGTRLHISIVGLPSFPSYPLKKGQPLPFLFFKADSLRNFYDVFEGVPQCAWILDMCFGECNVKRGALHRAGSQPGTIGAELGPVHAWTLRSGDIVHLVFVIHPLDQEYFEQDKSKVKLVYWKDAGFKRDGTRATKAMKSTERVNFSDADKIVIKWRSLTHCAVTGRVVDGEGGHMIPAVRGNAIFKEHITKGRMCERGAALGNTLTADERNELIGLSLASPENGMYLSRNVHNKFDNGLVFLKPLPSEHMDSQGRARLHTPRHTFDPIEALQIICPMRILNGLTGPGDERVPPRQMIDLFALPHHWDHYPEIKLPPLYDLVSYAFCANILKAFATAEFHKYTRASQEEITAKDTLHWSEVESAASGQTDYEERESGEGDSEQSEQEGDEHQAGLLETSTHRTHHGASFCQDWANSVSSLGSGEAVVQEEHGEEWERWKQQQGEDWKQWEQEPCRSPEE